jgi:hypothetical protein
MAVGSVGIALIVIAALVIGGMILYALFGGRDNYSSSTSFNNTIIGGKKYRKYNKYKKYKK